MTNRKLTLIVGAGASKEFGLPVGSELKQTIASLLDIRFYFVVPEESLSTCSHDPRRL